MSAIYSGYRGRFQPDIDDEHTQDDYFGETVVGASIAPGTEGSVVICVGSDGVVPAVWPGLGFSLRQGARVVARGQVTEVLADDD